MLSSDSYEWKTNNRMNDIVMYGTAHTQTMQHNRSMYGWLWSFPNILIALTFAALFSFIFLQFFLLFFGCSVFDFYLFLSTQHNIRFVYIFD